MTSPSESARHDSPICYRVSFLAVDLPNGESSIDHGQRKRMSALVLSCLENP